MKFYKIPCFILKSNKYSVVIMRFSHLKNRTISESADLLKLFLEIEKKPRLRQLIHEADMNFCEVTEVNDIE